MGFALEAHDLRKSFDGVVAVESLSLEVEAGQVLGFLGPNGAGKTTVIRILSTILAPDSGTFSVDGVPQTRPGDIKRRLGVLPESAGYPHGQTGEEWLTYHARLYGRTGVQAKATSRRLLDEVGLADRGRARIATYSRGMRQRLGIARALVNDPAVVFLDEPTLGLDPGGQAKILDLVTRMSRSSGVCVVLSTHLLAEVEHVCDQVLILNRGRTVAEGTVADVVSRNPPSRNWVVRVPPQLHERARAALEESGIAVSSQADGDRGRLDLTVPGSTEPEQVAASALGCLLAAGVSVLSLVLEGGGLTNAFLALTEASDD